MRKRYFKFGFTLVEIMVAIALFATLSVVVFSVLKSSLDSTMRQKTQQSADINAKNLLNLIVDDLKSSSVLSFKLPLSGGSGNANNYYNYNSSVIYPALAQFSTTSIHGFTGTTWTNEFPIGLTANGLQTIRNNTNRILFYSKAKLNATTNMSTDVIEYKTVMTRTNSQTAKCNVVRRVYSISENSLSNWPGIILNGTSTAMYAIDNKNIEFSSASLGSATSEETVLSLPNVGDIALIYLARSWDDTFNNGLNTRKFAANQYVVKVMVFQTVRAIPLATANSYFTYGTTTTVNNAFTTLFSSENSARNKLRNNYRYAEFSSAVGVHASSMHLQ